MVVNNKFLEECGKMAVRAQVGETPRYMFFAGSDNTFTGAELVVNNDFIRKPIIWTQSGIDSKFNLELGTVDAIGSYIYTYGFVYTGQLGSDTPLVSVPSDIGSKSGNFSVEVEGELLFRRPLI